MSDRWDSVLLVIDEEEFWLLVKTLGRYSGDEDFDRLTARLASRPEADITGFADRLAMVLWRLDTPAHFAAARTASDDVFLYVRCAVVAAGRSAYDRVLRKPAALEKFADEEAELLLTVAEHAFEQATGMLWEHDTAVSYETGSNTAAWGGAEPVPVGSSEPQTWLELSFGSGPAGPPRTYALFLHKVVEAVTADPAWRRWWAPAGVPSCELSLLLDGTGHASPEATVKTGRKRIRVHVTRDPGPFPTDDPAGLLARATDQIHDLLNLARERLGLGPLPPLPTLPLPSDLAAELFQPDLDQEPPPMIPAELLERMMRGESLGPQAFIDHFRAHPDAEGAVVWQQLDADGR